MKYLLENKYAKIIISVLWGLGLATLFQRVCVGRECIILQAPERKKMLENIFKYNDKCYKYKIKYSDCTNDVIT